MDEQVNEIRAALGRSRRREEQQAMRKVSGAVAQRALADPSKLRKRCDALPYERFKSAEHIEGELVELLALACRALTSVVDALGEKQEGLRQKLHKARADLRDQGGHVRSMDAIDLGRAKALGLVKESVVDQELARRRKAFGTEPSRGLARESFATGGAVVGGFLLCAHSGCNRAVPVADGSYCPEHAQAAPRVYFDARSFTSVHLDDLFEDAERRHAKARAEADQAAAEIAQLKQRIEAFDKNREQPDDA